MATNYQIVHLPSDSKDYSRHKKIILGKAGNHQVYYCCQLYDYKKNAICGISKRSKKEMLQHQKALLHYEGKVVLSFSNFSQFF